VLGRGSRVVAARRCGDRKQPESDWRSQRIKEAVMSVTPQATGVRPFRVEVPEELEPPDR